MIVIARTKGLQVAVVRIDKKTNEVCHHWYSIRYNKYNDKTFNQIYSNYIILRAN